MRIDNRKVNGRITIDWQDLINVLTILVKGREAMWITGVDKTQEPIKLSASVAGTYIKTALDAFNPVYITVTMKTDTGFTVLPMPVYALSRTNDKLSMDIGELITGVILEIALPSGTITVKESK